MSRFKKILLSVVLVLVVSCCNAKAFAASYIKVSEIDVSIVDYGDFSNSYYKCSYRYKVTNTYSEDLKAIGRLRITDKDGFLLEEFFSEVFFVSAYDSTVVSNTFMINKRKYRRMMRHSVEVHSSH